MLILQDSLMNRKLKKKKKQFFEIEIFCINALTVTFDQLHHC